MSSPTPEPLWTVQQVASFLSMSVSWVYKEVEANRLPCIRLGAAVRFAPEEIRRFLEGLRSASRGGLKGHEVANKLDHPRRTQRRKES
jgi:excisionase family DNA binding protein